MMKHITNILVHSNRCEILDGHIFEKGDKGFPHIRLKFLYKFGLESLQGKNLECKYILPDKSYTTLNISISEEDEIVFPIHYSVFTKPGWSTLKIALTEGNNRVTLDDIVIKVKYTAVGDIYQDENVQKQIELEISNRVKEVTNEGERQKRILDETKIEILNAIDLKKQEQVNLIVESAVNAAFENANFEPAFEKKSAFNLEKSNSYWNDNENVLITEKALYLCATDYLRKLLCIIGSNQWDLPELENVGTKEQGKYYKSNTTNKIYYCKQANSDVSVTSNFEERTLDKLFTQPKGLDLRTVWEGRKSDEGVVCTLPENWKICFVNLKSDETYGYPQPQQCCFTNMAAYKFFSNGDFYYCELLNNQIKIISSFKNIYISKVEVLM